MSKLSSLQQIQRWVMCIMFSLMY